MLIYQLVFGIDSGQVSCAFHDDTRASAGVNVQGTGGYNCFACGAKASSEVGFIAKYFGVGMDRAVKIKDNLDKIQTRGYIKGPVTDEQRQFLLSIGIDDALITQYFFASATGKLIYDHKWNGISVGYTWFNNPKLSNYSASADKYKYDGSNIGGSLTPYDDVVRYKHLILCEGEKDMLTAKSKGFKNAVAKIGGAKSYVLPGVNFNNKKVVIIYDCDEFGRVGAEQDADLLTERCACQVKVVDLGLQDGEDLNDYFIKYGKSHQDLMDLIAATPIHVPKPKSTKSKLQKFVDALSPTEYTELEEILKERKGD